MNPDLQAKTCSSLLSYAPRADGSLVETGEVLVAPAQGITLEMTSVVRNEGGALCGVVQLADLRRGIVRVNGARLPPERNASALASLVQRLAPMAGRKACETLRFQNGQLMKFGRVDQVNMTLPGKPVRWVDAAAGFRVAASARR
ncbi:hypothetical protein [Sphingomonas glaciei]|uniref:Nuclease n=1 Tax=Sphingomonas glaciei TaxID=2938948 RepID=A0ABY5MUZ4_9SPHN|nr:hypothetical protein [Sphingomonas glaciei]UUR08048.1 hypothetical protein M1K48_14170 [Sphingomonas glaciei]